MASPELSPSQRSATVTLGTTAGDVVVTLSEEDARYRRFSRTACLLVAGRLARQDLVSSGILAPNAKALIDAGDFLALSAIGKYLTACLAFVDDSLVGSARPVALRAPVRRLAARRARRPPRCPVSRVPVRLSASQATSLLHIDAKRAGAPPPTLRVTCRTTRGRDAGAGEPAPARDQPAQARRPAPEGRPRARAGVHAARPARRSPSGADAAPAVRPAPRPPRA